MLFATVWRCPAESFVKYISGRCLGCFSFVLTKVDEIFGKVHGAERLGDLLSAAVCAKSFADKVM